MVRLGLGALLLTAGLVGFLASRGQLAAARAGLLFTGVVVLGLVLLSSPWWVALATELRQERWERIRAQERAELAAHLHDSVLQTLALIQKGADDADEVVRLARGQERLDAFHAQRPALDGELDPLTTREREVLRLLARGYAYEEIAAELFIGLETVETHASAVLRTLQLSNRRELSRWARGRALG